MDTASLLQNAQLNITTCNCFPCTEWHRKVWLCFALHRILERTKL